MGAFVFMAGISMVCVWELSCLFVHCMCVSVAMCICWVHVCVHTVRVCLCVCVGGTELVAVLGTN